jgi:riboflavin synthase
MFSGIVEASGEIVAFEAHDQSAQVKIKIPSDYNDLNIGDSLSVDGVCLTVEAMGGGIAVFTLGPETLKVTGWNTSNFLHKKVNLERSLRVSDRVHGHFVSGHVDAMGVVESVQDLGECRFLTISYPVALKLFVWQKGSIAVNGVSLTINALLDNAFRLCLIPETMRRTNLSLAKEGDLVTLEADSLSRAFVRRLELQTERSL